MCKCENCNCDHDKKYGSGRFCSAKCARGFSTKKKRKEINYQVSLKMSGRISNRIFKKKSFDIFKICEMCGKEFPNKKAKTCSKECGTNLASQKQRGKKKIGNYKNNGGLREGGGKAKQILYINWMGIGNKLNSEEIEVAKIMDTLKIRWERNWRGFEYETKKGEIRKFYPDFYLNDYDFYIEYKGWITDDMRYKMKKSKERNNINLIIVVGTDRRYKKDGLSLCQFEIFLKTSLV